MTWNSLCWTEVFRSIPNRWEQNKQTNVSVHSRWTFYLRNFDHLKQNLEPTLFYQIRGNPLHGPSPEAPHILLPLYNKTSAYQNKLWYRITFVLWFKRPLFLLAMSFICKDSLQLPDSWRSTSSHITLHFNLKVTLLNLSSAGVLLHLSFFPKMLYFVVIDKEV